MKYFIGLLATIGMIILVIILIIKGLSGGSDQKTQVRLSDYATTDAIVRLTVDGPIGSDIEHKAYQITVGRNQTTAQTYQGYDYNTLDTLTYSNSQEGYANFLKALELAGFMSGNSKSENKDPRGYCATGKRYIFEVVNGTSEIQKFWSTSCGGQGTYKGNLAQTLQLFNKQVPAADQKVLRKAGF